MRQRRTRGDGGLYKRSDGLWIGAVDIPTENGERKRKTVASKDKSKALNKLRELKRDVEEGRVTASPSITVEKWLNQWLETIVEPSVAPSTFESYYEPVVRLHLVPNIGHHRLAKFTPTHVRALMRKLEAEPTPAAKRLLALKRPLTEEEQAKSKQTGTRTAQKAHQVLTKALSDAVDEGILARNVVQVVEKPDHIAEEKEPFTIAEARQIIATAFGIGHPLATMWVTLFFTTARQGEAIGLELDRCDLQDGVFHFDWQLQYRPKRKIRPGFEYRDCTEKLIFTPLKSKKSHRHVAMTDPVWRMMKQYIEAKSGPNPHGLVWHHPDGRPLSPGDADDAWRELIEKSGVRYRSMHATRHTTNTLLNNARVTQETRMAISGHSSVRAQEGYVHADIEAQRTALSNLNELLS
ncbi:tyrosine-type recombinase/integrase [Mycobacteroides abscessus]|uniref:tyrosine-type recombinase/integrase n=1 Tax=Mycobacteroides abscessus TaxID=36809 RepID=UPI000D902C12|nr:tyrosine-type recombinase/integrase [Mycobacteroides abscessus]SPX87626.1 Putative phage integrase [Mycobacteroides abscessus]